MRISALLIGLALIASRAPAAGLVTTVAAPDETRLEDVVLADVDGDGRDDLVLAVRTRKIDFARRLLVYLRRDGRACFPPEPDRTLDLTPDVVAFAVGDVAETPGSEMVLFAATGVYSWRAGGGEEERPRKLVAADLLWQLPHPRETTAWMDGLRDLDGDGLVDLLVPEPGGYRVALQTRPEDGPVRFDRVAALRLPDEDTDSGGLITLRGSRTRNRERWRELRVGLSLGVSDRDEDRTAIAVHDSIPAPVLLDWNADGRLDVLALGSEELVVFVQGADGAFETFRQDFPLTIDRSRQLDLSFGALAADIDADRRADCVVLAGDRRSEKARTQVLVYRQSGAGRRRAVRTPENPLFGPSGNPDQALFIGGFTGSTDLVDVDGDGRPDLVLGVVNVDAVDILRAQSSGSLDASVRVHLNDDGTFSRKPDLALTVPLPADQVGQAGRRLAARFLGDVTGNRVRELLLRPSEDRIRVLGLSRGRGGLVIRREPLFETSIGSRADVRIHARDDGPGEVIVLESKRLHHVRFR